MSFFRKSNKKKANKKGKSLEQIQDETKKEARLAKESFLRSIALLEQMVEQLNYSAITLKEQGEQLNEEQKDLNELANAYKIDNDIIYVPRSRDIEISKVKNKINDLKEDINRGVLIEPNSILEQNDKMKLEMFRIIESIKDIQLGLALEFKSQDEQLENIMKQTHDIYNKMEH